MTVGSGTQKTEEMEIRYTALHKESAMLKKKKKESALLFQKK